MRKVLYLTFDGLTDPLGQSQILPYLLGLESLGTSFIIISVEKKQVFRDSEKEIRKLINGRAIEWIPIRYHQKPPILSTCYDLIVMGFKVRKMLKNKGINFLHCRSYLAAIVALNFKKWYGVPYLFDMRGFWADERVEGNIWSLKNPLYKLVYRFFKSKEKQLLERSDSIIVLTNKAERIITDFNRNLSPKITVIPCCVDIDHFNFLRKKSKTWLKMLNIEKNDIPIIGYLGSLGTWYLMDEMLLFFKRFLLQYPNAILLVITKDREDLLWSKVDGLKILRSNIRYVSVGRKELPELLSILDIALYFIRSTYSKQASSPTKQGELLSSGIPIITNVGVGDSDLFFEKFPYTGLLVKEYENWEYDRVISKIKDFLGKNKEYIRQVAVENLSLQAGIESYQRTYNRISR